METLHEFMLITKAVEYLIAVGFLFLFIMFWRMLLGYKTSYGTIASNPAKRGELYLDSYLSTGHAWLRKKSAGDVLVGIDDFLQELTGSLREIRVPIAGSEINAGEPLIRLLMGSEMIQVNSPVTGEVTAVNWKLIGSKPFAINLPDNPAWLVKVRTAEELAKVDTLVTGDSATGWLHKESNRLLDFLSDQSQQPDLVGITLADGGIPVHGALQLLNADGLKRFEKEFLGSSQAET